MPNQVEEPRLVPEDVVYRKDQYVVCRYLGRGNGDLIVGRVKSARNRRDDDEIILENLLTGTTSTKKRRVLFERNVVIYKKAAEIVVRVYRERGLEAARDKAVQLARQIGEERRSEEGEVRLVRQRVLVRDGTHCHKSCAWLERSTSDDYNYCKLFDEPLDLCDGQLFRCQLCITEELPE